MPISRMAILTAIGIAMTCGCNKRVPSNPSTDWLRYSFVPGYPMINQPTVRSDLFTVKFDGELAYQDHDEIKRFYLTEQQMNELRDTTSAIKKTSQDISTDAAYIELLVFSKDGAPARYVDSAVEGTSVPKQIRILLKKFIDMHATTN